MARKTRPRAQALRATTSADDIQPEVEEKKKETVGVPAALLLAAESIAAKAAKEQMQLRGVLLHMKDTGLARVVATDGQGGRLFVGSFGTKGAAWLKAGVMLAQEDLKARVTALQKIAGTSVVQITAAKGEHFAEMSDPSKSMRLQVGIGPVEGFPPYEENIKVASFTDFDPMTGEQASREDWKPIGISSRHMKHCSELAKILESAIPKDERDPDGMVVRMFNGAETAPRVFDFSGWPGALLVIDATWPGAQTLAPQAVALLAGPLKLTVAALRAHETRWRDAAAEADTEERRVACNAKADTFRDRVARILETAPDPKLALPAPAPAAAAVEGPEVDGDRILTRGEKSAATRRKRAADRAATVH